MLEKPQHSKMYIFSSKFSKMNQKYDTVSN